MDLKMLITSPERKRWLNKNSVTIKAVQFYSYGKTNFVSSFEEVYYL
jgi:hypothetical protein